MAGGPRKFSEKIALLNQKEAEGNLAFDSIMVAVKSIVIFFVEISEFFSNSNHFIIWRKKKELESFFKLWNLFMWLISNFKEKWHQQWQSIGHGRQSGRFGHERSRSIGQRRKIFKRNKIMIYCREWLKIRLKRKEKEEKFLDNILSI